MATILLNQIDGKSTLVDDQKIGAVSDAGQMPDPTPINGAGGGPLVDTVNVLLDSGQSVNNVIGLKAAVAVALSF